MNQLTELTMQDMCNVPAQLLGELASELPVAAFPVVIFNNHNRSVLAAEALWLFAQRTGLTGEGGLMETVLTDFMANVMHLCRETGVISEDWNRLPALLLEAEQHFEQEVSEGS